MKPMFWMREAVMSIVDRRSRLPESKETKSSRALILIIRRVCLDGERERERAGARGRGQPKQKGKG